MWRRPQRSSPVMLIRHAADPRGKQRPLQPEVTTRNRPRPPFTRPWQRASEQMEQHALARTKAQVSCTKATLFDDGTDLTAPSLPGRQPESGTVKENTQKESTQTQACGVKIHARRAWEVCGASALEGAGPQQSGRRLHTFPTPYARGSGEFVPPEKEAHI